MGEVRAGGDVMEAWQLNAGGPHGEWDGGPHHLRRLLTAGD